MIKHRSLAVTLFPLFSTAAAMHTALILVAFRETLIADHWGLGIWWLFLTVYRLVMAKFLESPRELRSIVLLSAVFVAAQLCVTWYCSPIFTSLSGWLAAIAMWITTYYRCANALSVGVKPEALMVNCETTVFTLLISAVVISNNALAPGILIHLCISLFCILIAMMRQRTLHTRIDTQTRESTAGLLLPLILLALAALVVLFCIIISGSAADVLTQITAWIARLLSAAAKLVGAFFTWLFSLFPQEQELLGDEFFYVEPLPSGQQEQVSTSNGIVLYLLIAAIAAGFLFCVLKFWRKLHLRGRSANVRTAHTVVVKKNPIWTILKDFFEKLRKKLLFNLQYLRRRNTGPGLLIWIERRMRGKRLKRKPGETASAFLTRIGTLYPLCQGDLLLLAQALDRYYFGAGDDLSPETVRALRKKLNSAFSQPKQTQKKKSHS